MSVSNELKTLEMCVLKAGSILSDTLSDKHIEMKSSSKDLVTMYDKAVQEKLYRLLSEEFPKAGFLGEEGLNSTEGVEGIFIIDPIDGTTNFIKGMAHSAISVGYCRDNRIEYAAVYNPFRNEFFTAERGKGAYLNGTRIFVSEEPIEKSVGLYGTAPYNEELRTKSFILAEEMTKRTIDSRRMGSAALDLCYVACGRGELYAEYLLSPWDYSGGSLIAEEAGAIVSDMYGKPLQFKNKTSIAVGNRLTHPVLLEMIDMVDKNTGLR